MALSWQVGRAALIAVFFGLVTWGLRTAWEELPPLATTPASDIDWSCVQSPVGRAWVLHCTVHVDNRYESDNALAACIFRADALCDGGYLVAP